jgi:hypothetical protein
MGPKPDPDDLRPLKPDDLLLNITRSDFVDAVIAEINKLI